MSTDIQASTSTPKFQLILDKALSEYKKKTKKDLITDPLAEEIRGCDSPEAILAVLRRNANDLNQSHCCDERLTKWLTPTVNVLNALSATVGQGVGIVFPPTQIIFSGINILLVAARDAAASRDALIELFDKIENFFIRLQTYTEVPPTPAMTNVMGKIMAEVLCMLAIATKVMKQGRTKTFFKNLVGRKDIEDALQRLDKLEQGELRTVAAQVLKATGDIKDGVKRIEAVAQQIETDVGARNEEQLLEKLQEWVNPSDPSTNHNTACSVKHERTAAWVFSEDIYKEWESSGSLLWIHGKAGSGKSIICSAIIQHIIALRNAGSASVAYFYFDFRDVNKKHRRDLLSSLLMQLSSRSTPCLSVLSRLYSSHNNGKEQPNEHTLVQCLKDMLMAPSLSQLPPTYIVLDAVDECPNTSGIPTPREQVLELVKDLSHLRLPNLRMCITSRPEIDIRTALEPLVSGHFSLHDQLGQKTDITKYVNAVVQSDTKMKRWREDDRKLVSDTLSEKADGMFRWVFCQLEMLRHCLAPSLRDQLTELPESLDETYERVLVEIESTKQGRYARRLLQCLVVAMRPLRVEELAEVLAFNFDVAKGDVPSFNIDWRWAEQEQAVMSTCSSLITIVGNNDSRVIQFSHFSVKEYLTSDRLASASGDVSRYHIVPEPAHSILAQACLAVLLRSDVLTYVDKLLHMDEKRDKDIPLLIYAAEHWTSHAQVGNVSSRLKNAMKTLFDVDKPYFSAWRLIFHGVTFLSGDSKRSQLYWAARYGFFELVQNIIDQHPEQVYEFDSPSWSPLVAALRSSKHIPVAELLLKHGAQVHIRRDPSLCCVIESSDDDCVDAVQFLLKHGAHVNARGHKCMTPLHLAAEVGDPDVARILLEHGADVTLRNEEDRVPLHLVSSSDNKDEGDRLILARLLLEERCADVHAQDMNGATPLHLASWHRQPKIVQLLLHHGANTDAKNVQGRNALHELLEGLPLYSDTGLDEVDLQNSLSTARLLLRHGVDVNALDNDHSTPLHLASSHAVPEIVRLLLDHGAKGNAENVHGRTSLHLMSQRKTFFYENTNVARALLENGLNVNAQDKDQATPLHFACSFGKFETALVLLNQGADVNVRNADGQTPLHGVSQDSYNPEEDNPRVARLMLEHGADVNARDKNQETPLHLASHLSKLETARLLLDHGANIHAEDIWGRTPLHMVSHGVPYYCEGSGLQVVRLLLNKGADVNARDKDQATPFLLASLHCKLQTAEELLRNGADVNAVNIHGQNAFHLMSQNPRLDGSARNLGNLLLKSGVDINGRDKDEKTPLHLACYYGQVDVAETLLDYGAQANAADIWGDVPLHQVPLGYCDHQVHFGMDSWHRSGVLRMTQRLLDCDAGVNAQNKDLETPLHRASRLRLHDIARLLLKHGADVDVRNSEGKSPLQLATGRKGKAMRRLLSGYSAK